ncbi:PREDICTED: uncharacterized protein LOC109129699 isoform X2 [Camelina sativa]|uniref:Uncharacterized protein LOC109129699 isoform X1 n=1 Tax=Camelina sativa TaxID=90675 RepID=A0ABM1R4K1_CAMSA|nr:PREDICTED: uncharacterized protein LOC109129699 isoform X1 [Camelina sativa]XP_019093939.1 PREDICTED: uncharacterized protein LOC109129699 isoform X2 [Camelina sativa]
MHLRKATRSSGAQLEDIVEEGVLAVVKDPVDGLPPPKVVRKALFQEEAPKDSVGGKVLSPHKVEEVTALLVSGGSATETYVEKEKSGVAELSDSIGDIAVAVVQEPAVQDPGEVAATVVESDQEKDDSVPIVDESLAMQVDADLVEEGGTEDQVVFGMEEETVSGEELVLAGTKSLTVDEPPHVGASGPPMVVEKARKGKGLMGVQGLGSKKLNVYVCTPRKRPAIKSSASVGETITLKPQEVEKGIAGGANPPILKGY